MSRSTFRSMSRSVMVTSAESFATDALTGVPPTYSPMFISAAKRQGGNGYSMCAKICTWLILFNTFSVGAATSHHGSMFLDHSMIKWFDAVSSRFKTEANSTIFGSFHHVAAHMYDMHHRMAHSPAMDDEFSDVFFHIATMPRIAPSFGAS